MLEDLIKKVRCLLGFPCCAIETKVVFLSVALFPWERNAVLIAVFNRKLVSGPLWQEGAKEIMCHCVPLRKVYVEISLYPMSEAFTYLYHLPHNVTRAKLPCRGCLGHLAMHRERQSSQEGQNIFLIQDIPILVYLTKKISGARCSKWKQTSRSGRVAGILLFFFFLPLCHDCNFPAQLKAGNLSKES